MEFNKRFASRYASVAASLLMMTGLLLIGDPFISTTPFIMATAAANTHLGIEGQMAPELNLSNWIDGNGKKTNSIELSDYRGKVVYLYFFQDW